MLRTLLGLEFIAWWPLRQKLYPRLHFNRLSEHGLGTTMVDGAIEENPERFAERGGSGSGETCPYDLKLCAWLGD